jgi:DNA polymerase IV
MGQERIILHVDVNSAFLSWSAVKRLREDPFCVDLRTVPSAVGGSVETRHGIITAKSIPAKKFGITTGEPVVKALQKCPGLILVSSDWEAYREYSKAFIGILREFSELVQQASVDEAYVDVTEAAASCAKERECGQRDAAVRLADQIRRQVYRRLGFTVNVGISSNKLLAKMASDFEKPDRTHTLWPEEIPDKMWPLPIGSLYGCGGKTAERLAGIGIITIKDAAAADLNLLKSFLGEKSGEYIYRASRGLGSDEISTQSEDAKSYSNEVTTAEDVTLQNFDRLVPPILSRLSEKVSERLKRDGVYGSTVTVTIKTNDFHRHTRQTGLETSTNEASVICGRAGDLLKGLLYERNGIFDRGKGVRLIGVGVSSLDHGEYRQMDLEEFLREQETQRRERRRREQEEAHRRVLQEKRGRLEGMMQQVRQKYGEDKIRRGM